MIARCEEKSIIFSGELLRVLCALNKKVFSKAVIVDNIILEGLVVVKGVLEVINCKDDQKVRIPVLNESTNTKGYFLF